MYTRMPRRKTSLSRPGLSFVVRTLTPALSFTFLSLQQAQQRTASGRINLGGPSTGAPPPASEGGTGEEEEEEEEMPVDLATLSPEEQQKMIKRRYVDGQRDETSQ